MPKRPAANHSPPNPRSRELSERPCPYANRESLAAEAKLKIEKEKKRLELERMFKLEDPRP